MKKRSRPPQGTHSIASAKRLALARSRANALADAVRAELADPIVRELARAKREGDVGPAMEAFLAKYGRSRESLRLFRAL